MTWTAPTIVEFKARFPEFTCTDDFLVQSMLDEATAQVGEAWLERDRSPAVLYLAAHTLTLEGRAGDAAGSASGGVSSPIKRRKVGDVEVEFAGAGGALAASGASGSDYDQTAYGRAYKRLLRRNFAGVAVA